MVAPNTPSKVRRNQVFMAVSFGSSGAAMVSGQRRRVIAPRYRFFSLCFSELFGIHFGARLGAVPVAVHRLLVDVGADALQQAGIELDVGGFQILAQMLH